MAGTQAIFDRDKRRTEPVDEFIDTLPGELRELRVRFGNTRYRVLYQRSDNLIVLLHAFEKNTGAVPSADKKVAMRRMKDFKERMDAERRKPPRAAGRDAPPGDRLTLLTHLSK